MGEKIGLREAVSMAVGGMVGGGIFAVLGVVASAAGTAAWMAFLASGVVALTAGYSFVRITRIAGGLGPVGTVEELTGHDRWAGMVGWLFTFGYVGTMAMYAYAFGSYLTELVGVHAVLGLPARPLFSVAAVALFVGLNAVGARASGWVEDALVAGKVLVLLVFSVGGIYYGYTHHTLSSGVDALGIGPLTAAAIAFVAFEGWELLLFDRGELEDPETTVRRAVYVSVTFTTLLYVLVAIVTTNLVSTAVIKANPETALAAAARPFLGELGFVLIAVAAVISTASALNATLFSAARLTTQVTARGEDADRPDDSAVGTSRSGSGEEGAHVTRALLVLGTLVAVFTAYGSLDGITSFASGAFMTLFGVASVLALRERDSLRTAVAPAVGAVGSVAAVLALFWNLHRTNPDVLVTVAVIWTVVVALYWVPRRE